MQYLRFMANRELKIQEPVNPLLSIASLTSNK
jgi:hypothetical protein